MSASEAKATFENAGCPICQHTAAIPFLAKYGYTIARCAACDTLHVTPMPSDAALMAHYQEPGYFDGEAEQGYRSYADVRKALLPHFRRRLRTIESRIGRGSVLDYGCAAGYFLEVAQASGWQVDGVELSREMADLASDTLSIRVHNSLDDLDLENVEKRFDAVTLWDVVEHLPRPIAELRRLHGILRPGGLLMLSTPNSGHWQAIKEPENWMSYRPPSHLIYFTKSTLAEALERAGFERISIARVSPLPMLPGWLRRLSAPLQRSVVSGDARSWRISLRAWQAVRVIGLAWQKLNSPNADVFTTLEAVAIRPQ